MQAKNLTTSPAHQFALLPLKTLIPRLSGTPLAHGRSRITFTRSLEYPNPPKGRPRSRRGPSELREIRFHCTPESGEGE